MLISLGISLDIKVLSTALKLPALAISAQKKNTESIAQIPGQGSEKITTRLVLNNDKIDRKPVNKILGLWLTEDAGNWQKNVSEICKKAYGRVAMITKLKYAGVTTEDLIEIYCLFVRSCAEYCSVVWHSSLTQEQNKKIENIQKTSLKLSLEIILSTIWPPVRWQGWKNLKPGGKQGYWCMLKNV